MSPAQLKVVSSAEAVTQKQHRLQDNRPIGQILLSMGRLTSEELEAALQSSTSEARLGELLCADGALRESDVTEALARQNGLGQIDLDALPPDPRLVDQWGSTRCLADGLTPWRVVGGTTVVVVADAGQIPRLGPELEARFGQVRFTMAPKAAIESAIEHVRGGRLAQRAETLVPGPMSCRIWDTWRFRILTTMMGGTLGAGLLFAPIATLEWLTFWAVFTLALTTAMKAAAVAVRWKELTKPQAETPSATVIARRPVVSVLVPLFKEKRIARRLIERLSALDYPRALLDLCLVVEADDALTRSALEKVDLPPWMRVITVPVGGVKTKPRALNYALSFCRGSIVGIYDAEDAPDPGQINAIVERFCTSPENVACLQGVLDFYNSRSNWLSRCFTVEYASWFRVVLPGLAALGLVVPLGGTTLFFRRDALEKLGGWDAHNVTEDADLGVRLARAGYRTELIDSVTQEEANCRLWPWVRQRSRWLKGYAMTYAVHMRDPGQLWRDLGARRFLGVQILFLGTLSQFTLAPLLWSFWTLALGLGHPLSPATAHFLMGIGGLFLATELLNIAVGIVAVRKAGHHGLIGWVPTLHLYFPLGALAMYKALLEMLTRPFFWDKTDHGLHDDPQAA